MIVPLRARKAGAEGRHTRLAESQRSPEPTSSWVLLGVLAALLLSVLALVFLDRILKSHSLFITLPIQIVLGSITFLMGVALIVVIFAKRAECLPRMSRRRRPASRRPSGLAGWAVRLRHEQVSTDLHPHDAIGGVAVPADPQGA